MDNQRNAQESLSGLVNSILQEKRSQKLELDEEGFLKILHQYREEMVFEEKRKEKLEFASKLLDFYKIGYFAFQKSPETQRKINHYFSFDANSFRRIRNEKYGTPLVKHLFLPTDSEDFDKDPSIDESKISVFFDKVPFKKIKDSAIFTFNSGIVDSYGERPIGYSTLYSR